MGPYSPKPGPGLSFAQPFFGGAQARDGAGNLTRVPGKALGCFVRRARGGHPAMRGVTGRRRALLVGDPSMCAHGSYLNRDSPFMLRPRRYDQLEKRDRCAA